MDKIYVTPPVTRPVITSRSIKTPAVDNLTFMYANIIKSKKALKNVMENEISGDPKYDKKINSLVTNIKFIKHYVLINSTEFTAPVIIQRFTFS